jgi:uncharacterized protein YqjF (DUF2071 family)
MSQRWNDLLFAHWPIAASALAPLIPEGLQVDTYNGSGWLGVVPFWMDRVKFRGLPTIPGTGHTPELNLRTYVRDPHTCAPGVCFLSLDAASLLSVVCARSLYRLPYHWADMRIEQRSEREFWFASRRRMTGNPVLFTARYRGLGPTKRMAESRPGSLEYFLSERYCLFTRDRDGHPMRADIHSVPSPLEEAEAEIQRNDLAEAVGIRLPNMAPVLHYSRRLAVYVWQLERVRAARGRQRIPAAASV